ncbi:MAG: hypothetical protein J0I53_12805 [Chryseobacterium sp.]|nr:hypothetical protein [Chryseobacterium sp.]
MKPRAGCSRKAVSLNGMAEGADMQFTYVNLRQSSPLLPTPHSPLLHTSTPNAQLPTPPHPTPHSQPITINR